MKLIKLTLSLTFLYILTSCSSIKVVSDQSKNVDFSQYKTYSFLGWQQDSDKILNDFDKKRLHDAFKAEFEKRNLEYVEEGGDMAVTLFIVVSKETSTTAYTNYYGGYGGRYNRYGYGWGGGHSSTTYSESDYLQGTLVMDVFEEKSGDQLWQGIATGTIQEKPEKREKSIPHAVGKLMSKFPVATVK